MNILNRIITFKNERVLIFLILNSIFLILAVTGCTSPFASKMPAKQDVLLAQDCGMDGLKCCATTPQCSFGQACCVNPRNSAENYCGDKCGLGAEGQFCRDNDQCDGGLKCVASKCAKCGGENQQCCGSNLAKEPRCNQERSGKLICQSEKCVVCGEPGHPCCNGLCAGTDKKNQLAECQSDLCMACGGNGQLACITEPKCVTGYLFSNSYCYTCGERNQPCCANNVCHASKLICANRFCQER
jgi:hypothetical protein